MKAGRGNPERRTMRLALDCVVTSFLAMTPRANRSNARPLSRLIGAAPTAQFSQSRVRETIANVRRFWLTAS